MKEVQANEISIGIACPTYENGAKDLSEAKGAYLPTNPFDRPVYRKEWRYQESSVKLSFRENFKEDGRTRYNKLFICPNCGAELLLSVTDLVKIGLYQFSENAVRHYIHYMGYKTNCLYLMKNGQVHASNEKNYLSKGIYRTVDAMGIPKDYLPEHPKIFSKDWGIIDVGAVERIEDLSYDEIAIFLVRNPNQAITLLNNDEKGVEIAKRILKPEPNQVHEYLRPKPDTSEMLSAMAPFVDGSKSTNLTIATLDTYNNLVRRLFRQIVIAGSCTFMLALILRVFVYYPANIILSTLLIPLPTLGVLWFQWEYMKEVRRWQGIFKWLPENKHIRHAMIFRIIFILAQVGLFFTGLASCIHVK